MLTPRRLPRFLGLLLLLLIPALALELLSLAWLTFFDAGYSEVRAQRDVLAGKTAPGVLVRADRAGQFDFVAHPYLGYVHSRSASPVINRHGLPGWDLLEYASPQDYNVVVTGGSVAGNFFNTSWQCLKRGLEALPELAGRKLNLVSLSVAGYKQPQQLMAVAWFLSQGARIDLVINIDGYNEVVLPLYKNAPAGVNPLYPTLWKDISADFSTPEKRRLLGRAELLSQTRHGLARVCASFPLNLSATLTLAWSLADRLLDEGLRLTVADLESSAQGLTFHQAGPDTPLPQDREKALDLLAESWERSSRLLQALAASRGAGYLHVLQPNQYVEGSKPLTATEKRLAVADQEELRELPRLGYARLIPRLKALETSGVAVLDATMIFSGESRDIYYDACCHFNALGNEHLCDTIVRKISTLKIKAPSVSEKNR